MTDSVTPGRHLTATSRGRAGSGGISRSFSGRRVAASAGLVLLCILSLPLFVPAPRPVLERLVYASSDWILTDYDSEPLTMAGAARKTLGLWVQQSLAAHVFASQPIPSGVPDYVRLARRLERLRPLLLSSSDLYHAPVNAPVAVAGLGWCDAINGFAATILSHEFDRAEVVGVADANLGRHSFGRVWSNEAQDWLYFDAWPSDVVVFRSRPGRRARVLARLRPVAAEPGAADTREMLSPIYDLAHEAVAHNRLQPTLGGYLLARLPGLRDRVTIAEVRLAPDRAVQQWPDAWLVPILKDHRSPAAAHYLRGRLNHVFGDLAEAKASFRAVQRLDQAPSSTFRRAAQIFERRIDQNLRTGAHRFAKSGEK